MRGSCCARSLHVFFVKYVFCHYVTRRENRIGVYHRNDVVPSADVVVERAGGSDLGPERISVPSASQSDKVGRVAERAQGLRVCHTPLLDKHL